MASIEEMETTVTGIRREGEYYVWSADPVHLRKLDKMVAAGRASVRARGDEWGDYTIPASEFDPLGGFKTKRRPMTEEQRAVAAERMRKLVRPSLGD